MKASIQLWSVRLATETIGWPATLDRIAEIGFRHVEPYAIDQTAKHVVTELSRLNLSSPTSHGFLDDEHLAATLEAALVLGVTQVIHPHLDVPAWKDASALDLTASTLSAAADEAALHGMRVAFHNHDYELLHSVDGRAALFGLIDRLPASVGIEFDIYWSAIARQDPLRVIRDLGSRVTALHIKDGPFGGTSADQVALGAGALALDDILFAAPPDTQIVLSLDRMPGTEQQIWSAIERSFLWLHERGVA